MYVFDKEQHQIHCTKELGRLSPTMSRSRIVKIWNKGDLNDANLKTARFESNIFDLRQIFISVRIGISLNWNQANFY